MCYTETSKGKKSEIGFQKDSSCEVEPTMLDEFGTCVELHTLRLLRFFFGSRLRTPMHRALWDRTL